MDFCWCTITVQNINESIGFYTEIIGLSITRRFSPRPGMEIVFLCDSKGNEIELIYHEGETAASKKDGISIGFEVESLDNALSIIKEKGVVVTQGPFFAPDVKFFYISDPNGVSIQLVEKTAE